MTSNSSIWPQGSHDDSGNCSAVLFQSSGSIDLPRDRKNILISGTKGSLKKFSVTTRCSKEGFHFGQVMIEIRGRYLQIGQ